MQQKLTGDFTAGENLSWALELPDYPATDGWAVTYYFRGASIINVSGTGSGSDYSFVVTPAQSLALAPGRYFFQAFAAKSTTDKKLVDEGAIEVKPSLISAIAGFDGRSYNEKTYEAITQALGGVGGDGVQSYVVQNPNGTSREIRNYGLTELTALHKYFGGLVAQERAQKSGKPLLGTQYFSFGNE